MVNGPWNRIRLDTLKGLLIIQVNFQESCFEFYERITSNDSILKRSTQAWNTTKWPEKQLQSTGYAFILFVD